MLRLPFSILVASFLVSATGRSGGADFRKDFAFKSGDLGAFILKTAPKFGVRLLATNGLPLIPMHWRYRQGENEFQVMVEGNYFPQLHKFLTKAVGPPAGLLATNTVGTTVHGI